MARHGLSEDDHFKMNTVMDVLIWHTTSYLAARKD